MAAGGVTRWRRWVDGLPVLLALLVATVSASAPVAPTGATRADGAAGTSGQAGPVAVAERAPGVRGGAFLLLERGGAWTPAPDQAVAAASAHRPAAPGGRWTPGAAPVDGAPQARQETNQGRAPPREA